MKKLLALLPLTVLLASCSEAAMPLFRNQWTTNVPGAYVRGNMTLGDGATWVTVPGVFTNNGIAFFLGGTTYFADGIEVELPSIFRQNVTVQDQVTATNFLLSVVKYDDQVIPLNTLSSPSVQPDRVSFIGGLTVYGFDSASTEQLEFEIQAPHGISTNNAYGLNIHLHWTITTAPTGAFSNVVWGIEFAQGNQFEVFPSSTSTVRITNSIPGVRYQQHSEIVKVTNIVESTVIAGRLFRDGGNASDDYGFDALGLSLDATYARIQMGSHNEDGDY